MIHIFINALSASAGGGLTYIRNVVPRLANDESVRLTLAVDGVLRREIEESSRVRVLHENCPSGTVKRFAYEQFRLPQLIRNADSDVLLSPGNFALFRSPVPQILLSRNALYTSGDFMRDLRDRGDYRLWIDTKMKAAFAHWSVTVADATVAPSAAFAEELQRWTGKKVICIHHGFDHETFTKSDEPLGADIQSQLDRTKDCLRVLFVSHYNYYRNFETLIRAVALLKQRMHPRSVRLIFTCKLDSKYNPGVYKAETAANLVRDLDLREEVVELGAVPYASLHHLYRSCDIYASPAYAETFAHPLVEAMASGLPVIASDLPVHREICGQAARYFPCSHPESLADQIYQVSNSDEQRAAMQEMGRVRSRDFSWDKHVESLLELARSLTKKFSPASNNKTV
jgi:glycosyltransferase involved in cell wall biosynthesis